jgi:hypothetical protein
MSYKKVYEWMKQFKGGRKKFARSGRQPAITYCHALVTRHGVWIGNWIYWTTITRKYR